MTLAKRWVAFANADGGELLIGVEDDGTITGIDQLNGRDKELLRLSPTSQGPYQDATAANADGYREPGWPRGSVFLYT